MTDTPNQETMREKLKIDIGFAIGNGHYLSDDAREKSLERIMDALEAIIAEACTAARLDELRHLDGLPISFKTIKQPLDKRIAELNQPKEQPNV